MISFGELDYIQKEIYLGWNLCLNLCYVACYGSICDYALLKLIIGLKLNSQASLFTFLAQKFISFCTYN